MTDHNYSPGKLVWAKVEGHPYWPSLVCNSPHDRVHSKITTKGIQIHVQFFSSPPSRAWVKIKSIKPFTGNMGECKPGGMFYSSKKAFRVALKEAEKAEFMTLEERFKMVKNNNDDDDDGDSEGNKKHTGASKQSTKQPQVKKRKAEKDISKPSKMKKTSSSSTLQKTFKIGSKIPRHWKTAFVLMSTSDIPEGLTVYDCVKVPKKHIELEVPDESDEVNDLDSEDEIIDSDDDPGWTPEMDRSDEEEEDESQTAETETDEESLSDSDEDPGWEPSSKAKKQKEKMPKQLGFMNKQKIQVKKQSNASTKSKTSKKSISTAVIKPQTSSSSNVQDNNARSIVITDTAPTGPEPEVGDFMLEKEKCKDGNIPYLWRYKKGGLIQKFERKEEDGTVFYQNVLSFSDWWACFAHKYQIVETRVLFKYRNVEKITITKQPVIEKVQEPSSNPKPATTSTTNKHNKESTNNNDKPAERMQEQEISSTTQDSVDLPEPAFQIGKFVLDIKDQRNIDNFPIWKIESQILLKKYEPVFKNGKMLHKPVKTYRGYREISKHYLSVKVKPCLTIPGEEHVEVTEDTKPKITVTSTMEEEYEKNPLLRHFYVYMQVFLSQALEPGFLDEVKKTNDPTYVFPLGEVDKIVDQKTVNIERKVKWTVKIKDALKKCPYLREVNKPDDKRKCEAVFDSEEIVEESIFLFGSEYSKETLKQSGNSHPCQEFKIGKTAMKHLSAYHQLCHFKYNLYDKCLAKIKLIRDSKEGGVEVEKIMDECLGNKSWVLQNFEDFMTLVEMT